MRGGSRCQVLHLQLVLEHCFGVTDYLWYSRIAASMSNSDHWFNFSPWCDWHCLPMNEGMCFFGCLPFCSMLNTNKEKHMRTKTKMLDLRSLRTKTRVHLDLDLLIFACHKCANISTIFGRFTLETMYMIWVKCSKCFIIVNIQIDAMFTKELVFQMKWRFGKVMAYNTPLIEKIQIPELVANQE